MKKLLYIFLMLNLTACVQAQENNQISDSPSTKPIEKDREVKYEVVLDSVSCNLNFTPKRNYKAEKVKISKLRSSLNQAYINTSNTAEQGIILDSAAQVFTYFLLNNITPHWYGTVWDFNGYTSKPNEGTIACGYFVSTTLRDMGINVNRYKLAQQGPENEAISIALNQDNVLHLDQENIQSELKKLEDGIYFVGLDNHVGYLYINNSNSYFLHSNYINGYVMIENTEQSTAFFSSNYYVSAITGNKELLKKWLTKEEIKVRMK